MELIRSFLDASTLEQVDGLQPDMWVVIKEEDNDRKRAYCASHGIEYRVLRRLPRPGLPARQSTDFRGF